jgi:molybdenum cofactor guanylyltransferase
MRLGAVLAGGRSSRFGSDKAVAMLSGRMLLDRAIDALRPHVDAVMICGRPWRDLPWGPDRPQPDLGPLGGINAALHYAAAHGFDTVVTLACDVPQFPGSVAEMLRSARAPAYLANLPIIGSWPADRAEALDQYLAGQGDRSVRGWARMIGAVAVEAEMMLPNINTLADLRDIETSN